MKFLFNELERENYLQKPGYCRLVDVHRNRILPKDLSKTCYSRYAEGRRYNELPTHLSKVRYCWIVKKYR